MQRNKTQSEEKYVLSVVHNEEDLLRASGLGYWTMGVFNGSSGSTAIFILTH
jgi:hypothetical protein